MTFVDPDGRAPQKHRETHIIRTIAAIGNGVSRIKLNEPLPQDITAAIILQSYRRGLRAPRLAYSMRNGHAEYNVRHVMYKTASTYLQRTQKGLLWIEEIDPNQIESFPNQVYISLQNHHEIIKNAEDNLHNSIFDRLLPLYVPSIKYNQ